MYGKKYMGIQRTTFLIDEVGKVMKVWNKVKVPNHANEVLQYLLELAKNHKIHIISSEKKIDLKNK